MFRHSGIAAICLSLFIASCGNRAIGDDVEVSRRADHTPGDLSDAAPETVDIAGDGVEPLPDALPTELPFATDVGVDGAALAAGTILLLDYEMRHPISWSFFMDELSAHGHEVVYRRWFPHVTAADVEPDPVSGQLPFQAIVLSAGNSPSEPSPRMRAGEADNLLIFGMDHQLPAGICRL